MIIAAAERADFQEQRLGRVRTEFDPTGAKLLGHGGDALGHGARRRTAEDEGSAALFERAGQVEAEAMVDRRGQVAEFEDRAVFDAEDGGCRADGGREGFTSAAVEEATTFHADDTPGAVGDLGGIHRQGARADLRQQGVGRVIEAHQATAEGRVAVVEADIEGRRTAGAEDIARAGERAPGGGIPPKVVTGTGADGEIGEAGAGIADAVAEAAGGDVEVAREQGLRVKLQDPCPTLGDRTGGGDDGLELQGRAERIDVRDTVDVDGAHVDRAGGGAETDASFDDADRADVGRSGEDAARADRQNALGAGAVGVQGVERADGGITRGAHVVEDDPVLGVVTDVIKHARTRDGGVVLRRDPAGSEDVQRRAADDEAL